MSSIPKQTNEESNHFSNTIFVSMYVKFLRFYIEFHGNWHVEAPQRKSGAHKRTIIDGKN